MYTCILCIRIAYRGISQYIRTHACRRNTFCYNPAKPSGRGGGPPRLGGCYIGLIAYLVKANTELHERVEALESK